MAFETQDGRSATVVATILGLAAMVLGHVPAHCSDIDISVHDTDNNEITSEFLITVDPSIGSSTTLLLSQSGKESLHDVKLSHTIQGAGVTVTVSGARAGGAFSLPAKGVQVEVTIGVRGWSKGKIATGTLIADLGEQEGHREIAALRIRDKFRTPHITFESEPATALGKVRQPGKSTRIRSKVWIQENSGQPLRFDRASLVDIKREDWGGESPKAVQVENVRFCIARADEEPCATLSADRTFSSEQSIVSLRAYETVALEASIDGLSEPGLYSAIVRLRGSETRPQDLVVSFAVRYDLWIAVALITVAVVVSQVLRHWFAERSPRLRAHIGIAALYDQLNDILEKREPNDKELAIAMALRSTLRDLFARAADGESIAGGTDEIRRKLFIFSRLMALRVAIEKGHKTDDLYSKLLSIGQWLKQPGTTQSEFAKKWAELDQIEQQLQPKRGLRAVTSTGSQPPPDLIPSEQRLRKRLILEEWLVTLVLLLIAVGLGLRLLYFDSLTWGKPSDVLTAMLWGLGLHQVSITTVFTGISYLRTQFGEK